MKIRLAIPNNPVFNEYHKNINNDVDILMFDEKKCIELISNKRVEAAILSPFGYSKDVALSDYRIIPGPILALKGYTGYSSVYFRNEISNIFKTYIDNPDDFISIASKIIFSEKYDIIIEPQAFKNEIDTQIADSDIIISTRKSHEKKPVLDISEDWYDTFEIPLILGFWVVNSDLEGVDFFSLVNSLASSELKSEELIIEKLSEEEVRESRKGSIIRKWNEEIEYALDETIKLLYYHQYIKDIAAVKILGRD